MQFAMNKLVEKWCEAEGLSVNPCKAAAIHFIHKPTIAGSENLDDENLSGSW
jgi:hypothetical protein